MMISGRVLDLKILSKRREWGVAELETDAGSVRCTGDVAHLSRGDQVSALGHWRTTKWGREFAAQAILPAVLIPALREIESVIDRFAPPRPSRDAVFGLVIRLGKDAAGVMARNPFLPVIDKDREVNGWDYKASAQYADQIGIPADAEMRAVASVQHLWPRLADGSVVVSRDQLESRVATAAGIDSTAARRWVEVAVRAGLLESMGDQVAWHADAQAERAIARRLREMLASPHTGANEGDRP